MDSAAGSLAGAIADELDQEEAAPIAGLPDAHQRELLPSAEVASYVHGQQPVAKDMSIQPAALVFVESFGGGSGVLIEVDQGEASALEFADEETAENSHSVGGYA